VLVVAAALFIDKKLHIDDPVGAIAVHAVNGLWGVISLGLFADGNFGDGVNGVAGNAKGLLYGGGFAQLECQLIGVCTLLVWAFGVSFVFFKVQNMIWPGGIRTTAEAELEGLDLSECGLPAYHELISSGSEGY
jgi:Amt family ammonium transporter